MSRRAKSPQPRVGGCRWWLTVKRPIGWMSGRTPREVKVFASLIEVSHYPFSINNTSSTD